MKQHTIQSPVTVNGVGLHTGQPVTMTFLPAPENHGFKFKRTDLEGAPIVSATADTVVSTNRGTTIQKKTAIVHTIEHTLAALVGLGIDNVLIEIDGPEAPIMDGSSIDFVQKLQEVGTKEQDIERDYLVIEEPFYYTDETTGTSYTILPADNYQLTTLIDFNSTILGKQYASIDDISAFPAEIASCRTFVFLHEIEQLLNQNLIKGGDLNNAIVIVDKLMDVDAMKQLAEKLDKPNIKVEETGILNTTKLQYINEPARHKLLDVIGDLALVTKPIKGKIIANKPGHTANVQLAKQLKRLHMKQRKLKGKPKYDPSQTPLFDTMAIANSIPHRYPFLLVDKIIELGETHVVGVKNVTFNENFFQGHFPDNPVMPGVLQMEALAQTGGILALSTVEDPSNWDTYFLKMDKVRFKQKVVPGDTLILKMELLSPIRRGIFHMQGTAYVGDKIVSEGELTAQIIKRK